ncbi:hypothetical protein, partial [Phocaeicola vulgatus]|uniref:hypothetical protein n=1 Tax=Phocaeicola vulgatus TaxID=821 RepID=UPI001F2C93A5
PFCAHIWVKENMKIPIANKDSLVKKYFFIYAFVVRTIIRYGHNKQIPQSVKKRSVGFLINTLRYLA